MNAIVEVGSHYMFTLFKKEKSHYQQLNEKWASRHQQVQRKLWNNHSETLEWFITNPKHMLISSLAGIMLLTSPGSMANASAPPVTHEKTFRDVDASMFFLTDLSHVVPTEVRTLTPNEETNITTLLSSAFHLSVKAELEHKRLNTNFGVIGAEQHLARYPGDSLDSHFDSIDETTIYSSSGMAPGLGAWGYFAPSQREMTQKDILRERYYIAVQTFLAPGYTDHVSEYSSFFKYRKMLVINPQNGKAIVSVIADAGPSPWTGKQLGGSPEVMKYLERVDGAKRGSVLYFFIDDPTDQVPLGPISL